MKKSIFILIAVLYSLSLLAAYPIKLDVCSGINITNPIININFSFYDNSTNQTYTYNYSQNISYTCNNQNMFSDTPSINVTNYTNAYPGILFWYNNGWYFVNNTNVTIAYHFDQNILTNMSDNITSLLTNQNALKSQLDSYQVAAQGIYVSKTDYNTFVNTLNSLNLTLLNGTRINEDLDNPFSLTWKSMVILSMCLSAIAIGLMLFQMRNNKGE